ncbi:MAG: amidohydrolase family protein [Lachnospiraceae bacterium]
MSKGYKIIDTRLRPPYKSLTKNPQYLNKGATEGFANCFGSYMPESGKNESMEQLLEEMQKYNIVSGVMTIDNPKAYEMFEDGAELIDRYPGKFIGILGLDPKDVEGSLKDIEKYIVNGNYTGGSINPMAAGISIYDETLVPIYERLQELKAPLHLILQTVTPNPEDVNLLANKFPKLIIMIYHGFWPYFRLLTGVMLAHPNVHVSPDGFLQPAVPGYLDYVDAANGFYGDQILFGSCYPIHAHEHIVEYYENIGFREEVLKKVFYDNAAHVYGLENYEPQEWRMMENRMPIADIYNVYPDLYKKI